MCGRFCLFAPAETIIAELGITSSVVLTPRYNIAPSQHVPIVKTLGSLEFLTWGLRPVWLKSDREAFINARMETLTEKPAFKKSFQQRRCLIIANGYYEWKQIGASKQPYLITLPGDKLFAFAGIWDSDTCAIITKNTNMPELSTIHNREPVILNPEFYADWLNNKTSLTLLNQFMQQEPESKFNVRAVSTRINNPQNDSVECILPLS